MGKPTASTADKQGKLTVKRALNLAAPQTWAASVMPCLVGVCLALRATGSIDMVHAVLLVVICVFFQAAVNTFNDYFDFVKGTDTEEDFLEADDNVLVSYGVAPRSVLALAVVYLVIPFALGAYLVVLKGPAPLIVAAIGALAVVTYSAGKTPVSYLPIGEAVSGIVMGMLIPLGVWTVLVGGFSLTPLLYSIPCFLLVGLILQTNNTCDIEKDIVAGRCTMPAKVGRERSRAIYRAVLVGAIAAICLLVVLANAKAVWCVPFIVLAVLPVAKGIWANPLLPQTRIAAMGAVCSVNIVLEAMYCVGLLI